MKSVIGSSDNFKDFVLENYQHVNDVSDFALLAHMSVRNFQRKFKEEFKWPVREWLNERRAERILRDIRNTDKALRKLLQAMVLPLHPISRYSANNILV